MILMPQPGFLLLTASFLKVFFLRASLDCQGLEGSRLFIFMVIFLLQVQLGVKLPQKLREYLAV